VLYDDHGRLFHGGPILVAECSMMVELCMMGLVFVMTMQLGNFLN